MTPPNGSTDPVESTPATVLQDISALPALGWARVLLIAKQHGVLAALCLMMAYQIGVIASAQQYVCGV